MDLLSKCDTFKSLLLCSCEDCRVFLLPQLVYQLSLVPTDHPMMNASHFGFLEPFFCCSDCHFLSSSVVNSKYTQYVVADNTNRVECAVFISTVVCRPAAEE
jgi:hypothetical protein